MKNFKTPLLLLTSVVLFQIFVSGVSAPEHAVEKYDRPKIAFTFDDGSIDDAPGYELKMWNQMLLDNLKKHHAQAIFFSMGANKENEKGRYVLKSWNDAGHTIANHTFSHPNFNSDAITLQRFEIELLKNDSIIRPYSNYQRLFRFPYLKEGNTNEKVNGFRAFLKKNNYKNGYVTIDASDWYVSSRLTDRLRDKRDADVSGFKKYYREHLLNRAQFYDSLAFLLTGRRIDHVILLHHNLAAALFLDDAITYFKANGWEVINAMDAYKDDIYHDQPAGLPAGESLIWMMAKRSGKFENVLRYPGEDGEYEKAMMDKLGL